jgi:glycosyltransferase involved in cell wall biosynthesis
MPKISVIIPNYNNSKYLRDCVHSCFNQSFRDIEIIVVDDCSFDDSMQILAELQAEDARLSFYQMSKNSGVGAVRNFGIEKAIGDYIIFLDSDDMFYPLALENLMRLADSTGGDMIVGNYTKVPESFILPLDATCQPNFDFSAYADNGDFVNAIENLNLVTVWGKLIRRELLFDIKFNVEIYPYEDVEFMLRLYDKVRVGVITPCIAIYYRLSLTSVIKDKDRDVSKDVVGVLNSIAGYVNDIENREYKMFVKRYAFMFIRLYCGAIFKKLDLRKGDKVYKNRILHQLKKVAKTMRRVMKRGIFKDMRMVISSRIALCFFTHGFVKTGGKMLVFKDAAV